MGLKRTSTAVWEGSGLEGKGAITTQSGAFQAQPYSFSTRFVSEDGRAGTNPEELIAAAHAACFAMALSFRLSNAGHPPARLNASATARMEKQDIGWTIVGIDLHLDADVPGLDAAAVAEHALAAKAGCPISRALASVPISLTLAG